MDPDPKALEQSLVLLNAIVPYQYAQWLIEDPGNHDYRVVVSVLPEGTKGYATAHRTGIIGQVFRIENAILASDLRNHPLYDSFDDITEWELCFPVFGDGKMKAVVNLEGVGAISVGDKWGHICEVLQATTQLRPAARSPESNVTTLLDTRLMLVRALNERKQLTGIVDMAKAIAVGGQHTLLVGDYPDLLDSRGPNIAQARAEGLSTSYCYFGVQPRLDLLATGSLSHESLAKSQIDWWETSCGRYAFVLLQDETFHLIEQASTVDGFLIGVDAGEV